MLPKAVQDVMVFHALWEKHNDAFCGNNPKLRFQKPKLKPKSKAKSRKQGKFRYDGVLAGKDLHSKVGYASEMD